MNFDINDFICEVIPDRSTLRIIQNTFDELVRKLSDLNSEFKTCCKLNTDLIQLPQKIMSNIEDQKNAIKEAESQIQSFPLKAKLLFDLKEKFVTEKLCLKIDVIGSYLFELRQNILLSRFSSIEKNIIILDKYFEYIKGFGQISYVKKIQVEYHLCKQKILLNINRDFKKIFKPIRQQRITMEISSIKNIIHLLNDDESLKEFKQNIIETYTQNQMDKYKHIFSNTELKSVANYPKRFEWIEMFLKNNEMLFGLFPENWCFNQDALIEFCLITCEQLKDLLAKYQYKKGIRHLHLMITTTKDFEQNVCKNYETKSLNKLLRKKIELKSQILKNEFESTVDTHLIQEKKNLKEEIQKQPKLSMNYTFKGVLSGTFSNYMTLYVNHYKHVAGKKFKTLTREENFVIGKQSFIKPLFEEFESMIFELCVVTKGETLLNIKKQIFIPFIQKSIAFIQGSTPSQKKRLWNYVKRDVFEKKLKILACLVELKTSIVKLYTFIKERIEATYKTQISFQSETKKIGRAILDIIRLFIINIIKSISQIVFSIRRWEKPVSQILNTSCEICQVISVINDRSEKLMKYLSDDFSIAYVDYLKKSFTDLYFDSILGCKPINGKLVEQFKIDINDLKDCFFTLNKNEHDEYWDKIELIFKILVLPKDDRQSAADWFRQVFKKDGKKETFEKILTLRGWRLQQNENIQ